MEACPSCGSENVYQAENCSRILTVLPPKEVFPRKCGDCGYTWEHIQSSPMPAVKWRRLNVTESFSAIPCAMEGTD